MTMPIPAPTVKKAMVENRYRIPMRLWSVEVIQPRMPLRAWPVSSR